MSTPGIPKAASSKPGGPGSPAGFPAPTAGSPGTSRPTSTLASPAPRPAARPTPPPPPAGARTAPRPGAKAPQPPGYTPPRPLASPAISTGPNALAAPSAAQAHAQDQGAVETAPWDELNFTMPTPPPAAYATPTAATGYETAAYAGGAHGGSGRASAGGYETSAGHGAGYAPHPGYDAGYGNASPHAPEAMAAYGAGLHPPGDPTQGYQPPSPHGYEPAAAAHEAYQTADATPYASTWGAATGWASQQVPNPDSLLGRTAAKARRGGTVENPYETETIASDKLRSLRRRGRLGWLMALLASSLLAAGVSLGLEERQRLRDALAHERAQTAEVQQKAEAADRRAEQAGAALERLKAEAAARETTSEADRKVIADLKSQLSEKEGEIETAGREVFLNLVDDVMFDSGRADLSLNGYRVLARVGKVLKELPDKQIMIGGHTDDRPVKRGDFETNWELSAARAVNVARYLVEEVGVAPERVSAAAFSQYRPRGKSAARNRRIEVLLTPVVKVERKPAP